jgi:hypothetical protein
MKNVLIVALALVAGVQVTAARAADTQAANAGAKDQTAQAAATAKATPAGQHTILEQPAQKRWDSWDFSSGHDADGVPVPRS